MKIIAPVNNKGGVGKSTVSRILAEYFSKIRKLRVLAIDLDPQCNFSRRFLKMEIDPIEAHGILPPIHPDYISDEDLSWDGRSSIADIFFGGPVIPYPTMIENLDILPGYSSRLLEAEQVRKFEVVERVHQQLKKLLSQKDVSDQYDIVVIDTPPSKGPLTISVIRAASHILIPTVMEPQPIEGVFGMLQLWKQESLRRNRENPISLIGILPNMYRRVRLHEDLLDGFVQNSAISEYIMPYRIGLRTVFSEVDAEGAKPTTIFDLPTDNKARQEAITVCEYIEEKVMKNG